MSRRSTRLLCSAITVDTDATTASRSVLPARSTASRVAVAELVHRILSFTTRDTLAKAMRVSKVFYMQAGGMLYQTIEFDPKNRINPFLGARERKTKKLWIKSTLLESTRDVTILPHTRNSCDTLDLKHLTFSPRIVRIVFLSSKWRTRTLRFCWHETCPLLLRLEATVIIVDLVDIERVSQIPSPGKILSSSKPQILVIKGHSLRLSEAVGTIIRDTTPFSSTNSMTVHVIVLPPRYDSSQTSVETTLLAYEGYEATYIRDLIELLSGIISIPVSTLRIVVCNIAALALGRINQPAPDTDFDNVCQAKAREEITRMVRNQGLDNTAAKTYASKLECVSMAKYLETQGSAGVLTEKEILAARLWYIS